MTIPANQLSPLANLHALSKHPQKNAASQLFLVEAGIGRVILRVAVQDLQLSDIQTKDGSRIWIDVFLQDLSGGVSCKMGEDVALALTGEADADSFLQMIKKGKTFLPMRSYKINVTHSTVAENQYVNLSIVHASEDPTLPSIPPPEYTNKQGCMPAQIRAVSKNHFGNMVIGSEQKAATVELALVVLEGTKDAECEQRGDDVYVRNLMVKDLLSSDAGPFSVPVVTAVPLSSVPSMTLHAGRKVIAVVTDVLMKSSSEVLEVHASAMFTVGEEDIAFMKRFLDASLDFVGKSAGKRKRPWKDVNLDYVLSMTPDDA